MKSINEVHEVEENRFFTQKEFLLKVSSTSSLIVPRSLFRPGGVYTNKIFVL